VALSEKDEIALGLHAMPQMIRQHGGEHPDPRAQAHVDRIGGRLLAALNKWLAGHNPPRRNPFPFEFHLLRDSRTINAFALPGGQVFITQALYQRLQTEGQLAGVIGHEIGHVLSRHGAQRLAQQRLTQGLAGAAGVAGGDINSARLAQAVGELVNMRYGREDELESDKWGVRLCAMAGYDPKAMYGVMKVLEEAAPGGGPPEMMSTHPKPANRAKYVEEVIKTEFPEGLPPGLEP
jgi:predicted Zn-dependent protease